MLSCNKRSCGHCLGIMWNHIIYMDFQRICPLCFKGFVLHSKDEFKDIAKLLANCIIGSEDGPTAVLSQLLMASKPPKFQNWDTCGCKFRVRYRIGPLWSISVRFAPGYSCARLLWDESQRSQPRSHELFLTKVTRPDARSRQATSSSHLE